MYAFLLAFLALFFSACAVGVPGGTNPEPGLIYRSGQNVTQNVALTEYDGEPACRSWYPSMSKEELKQVESCHKMWQSWHRAGLTQQRENERQALARRRQVGREIDDVFDRARDGVRVFDQVIRTVDRHRRR